MSPFPSVLIEGNGYVFGSYCLYTPAIPLLGVTWNEESLINIDQLLIEFTCSHPARRKKGIQTKGKI